MIWYPSAMKKHLAALVVPGSGTLVLAAGLTAQAQRTIWDGVYTEAQAQRGEAVYKMKCTTCHSDNLRGNIDGGPPLRGTEFFVRWNNTPLSDMTDAIAELMPNDDPGGLPRQDYVDIITFLFRSNGIPAGTTELKADPAALQQVRFTDKPAK